MVLMQRVSSSVWEGIGTPSSDGFARRSGVQEQ